MRIVFLMIFFCLMGQVMAQKARVYSISEKNAAPDIDGVLDNLWNDVPVSEGFRTVTPIYDKKPAGDTRFRMFYTRDAIFLFVECDGKLLRRDGSRRDETGTGDYLEIYFDTWHDRQNSFLFSINASGVQLDGKHGNDGRFLGYDGVWQSDVKHTANGWVAEIRIPFVALRFPTIPKHKWGFQIRRFERSTGQLSSWNPHNPVVQDLERQFGILEGLESINQEFRHQLIWYGQFTNDRRDAGQFFSTPTNTGLSSGMDARLGWSSKTSLDFSLLPNVRLDGNRELFEPPSPTYLANNFSIETSTPLPRQFDEEENVMFGSTINTDVNVFPGAYGSQVLDTIQGFNFLALTGGGQLQGTRFTHQSNNGFGLSIFNSTYAPIQAHYINATSSFFTFEERVNQVSGASNFSRIAMKKTFKNNSWVLASPFFFYGSSEFTVMGGHADFQVRDPRNRIQLSGSGNLSNRDVFGDEFKTSTGRVSLATVNRPLNYGVSYETRSEDFVEELTFISSFGRNLPRYNVSTAFVQWNQFSGGKLFQNMVARVDASHRWNDDRITGGNHLFSGSVQGVDYKFNTWKATLSSPFQSNFLFYSNPSGSLTRKVSPYFSPEIEWASDSRKTFYGTLNMGSKLYLQRELNEAYYSASVHFIPLYLIRLDASFGQRVLYDRLEFLVSNAIEPLFTHYHQRLTTFNMNAHLFAGRRISLSLGGRFLRETRSDLDVVALREGGKLETVDIGASPEPFEPTQSPGFNLDFQWQAGLLSYIRLNYTSLRTPSQTITTGTGTVFTIGPERTTSFSASFIWFFDGPKSSYLDRL